MAKRGRPPLDRIQEFSVENTPWKGVFVVRFKVDEKAFIAFVREDAPFQTTALTLSPDKTFRNIAKSLREHVGPLGHSDDAVAKQLLRKFRAARPAPPQSQT